MGKTWTTSVRRLISLFSRSSGFVDWIFFQCWCGEVCERGQVFFGLQQHLSDLGELSAEHVGDGVELGADGVRGGLGEDGADRGCGHLHGSYRDDGEDVADEVKP